MKLTLTLQTTRDVQLMHTSTSACTHRLRRRCHIRTLTVQVPKAVLHRERHQHQATASRLSPRVNLNPPLTVRISCR